ncbi:MAG: aspartate aminotransferase family protein [Lacipirellulaceae bacterium]
MAPLTLFPYRIDTTRLAVNRMNATLDRFAALSPAWVRTLNESIVRGEGCWLYAESGRRYLDFTSGIGVTNTGHCHPRVVEAVQRQAGELLFGQMNCVVPATVLRLIEVLQPHLPPGLDGYFFSNSGAEATEGAVKLARMATGRPNVIAFHGGFHGRTAMTMALTSSKTVYRQGYQPLPAGVFFAPFPYPLYYGWSESDCVAFCLKELRRLLATQTAPAETAAMLIEPVLGEGGYIPAPAAFLEGLREVCDEHGILLVIDEIQSGFCRSGKWWAHEHGRPAGAPVLADVLVMAKGIASGLPMSAIVARGELMRRWPPGAHGGTYGGGSAVAQAAAIATIGVMEDERLAENAQAQGEYLTTRLRALQAGRPHFREVRGPGLMIGCEFAPGAEGKHQASAIAKHCAQNGLLLLTCGADGNVVRWIPPLVVTRTEIDEGLAVFTEALEAVEQVSEALRTKHQ